MTHYASCQKIFPKGHHTHLCPSPLGPGMFTLFPPHESFQRHIADTVTSPFLLRNCIGQTFAMNELKVVTALTLQKYQLIEDPAFKPKLLPRLILRSINGVHIKIKSLDKQE